MIFIFILIAYFFEARSLALFKLTKKRILLLVILLGPISIFFTKKSAKLHSENDLAVTDMSVPNSININQNFQKEISLFSSQIANTAPTPSKKAIVAPCIEKFDQDIFTSENNFQFQKKIIQSLDSFVGEWFYIKGALADVSRISSPAEKFFYALASAHLLTGLNPKIKLDRKLSLKLLAEVASVDPHNSAPLLYAAVINEEINDYTASKILVKQAVESTHLFNSYLMDFLKALTLASDSGEDFYRSITIHANHPVPDYLKLRDLILKYNLHQISEQLVKDGLNKDNLLLDYEWSAIDYTIGVATLKKLNPEYKLPLLKELMETKNKLHIFEPDKFFEEFQQNCDLKLLENEFLFLKSRLNKK